MQTNPYTLDVSGLTSKQAHQVISKHIMALERSSYNADDMELVDSWKDDAVKPMNHTKINTFVWKSIYGGNIPFNWRAYKNRPDKHAYAFHNESHGWNAFSTLEVKRAKLQPVDDVEILKLELYDSKKYGFHREYWLRFVPIIGAPWALYRTVSSWEFQATHRDANQAFMEDLQSDLQAKLNQAKALP